MEFSISLAGSLSIVPVSKVTPEDLVAFRQRSHEESNNVNRMNLREASEWVEQGDNFTLLMRDGEIVGQLVLDPNEPEDMYIDLISVLDSEKGKGGADRLFAQAVKQAKALKCKTLSLAVHRNNERALKFYKRRGFILVKRLGVDALLYSKQIERTT
jgi:ribosomal protein S18 acetylase RimI-like enzyme